MIATNITLREAWQGSRKFLSMKAGRTLFSVNLEVTRRCNLHCDFCDYWRTEGPEERLVDYSPILRRLDPLHLTITGGEPLLRPDLEEVVRRIRVGTDFMYMNLITNGSMLTVERALALRQAGLHQLSVSLDFTDERHDQLRGQPGLWNHLEKILGELSRSEMDNLCLNTVIMRENLGSLPAIVRRAGDWRFKVSFSTYNPFKCGNRDHFIPREELKELERVVEELLVLKNRHRNITNSDFYLENVPRYFREGGISGCLAGRKWLQVSPDGSFRRCSDKEALENSPDFKPRQVPLTDCRECWYACRGEAEAPLGLKRIMELNR